MVGVRQFAARPWCRRGVTSVIADPHEITNVLGLDGIRYMFDQAKYGQLSMFVMVPSCVPATHMATAGAYLEAKDIASLQNDRWVLGLGEMMNYPGVVHEDPGHTGEDRRVQDARARRPCAGLTGKALNAYLAAGIGSDHECMTPEEAQEKLRLGMYILIREATNAHNLAALLPMLTPDNSRRICFCTDDRHPGDLLDEGSVDHLVRTAIRGGRGSRGRDPHGDPQHRGMVPPLRPRRHPPRPPRRSDRLRRPPGVQGPAGDAQRSGGG